MDAFGTTYRQAFEKRAAWGLGLAKGIGKFLGAVPFWIGGSIAAEKILGKKPKVVRKYIPRHQYQQLLRHQQMMQQQQGGGY